MACLGILYARTLEAQNAALLPYEAEIVAPTFGKASDMEVGPDGRLYATFSSEGVVRIVDPALDSIRTVDIKGDVPAPFPSRIGWLGDTLWFSNLNFSQIALFDRSLNAIRTLAVFAPCRAGDVAAFGSWRCSAAIESS